MILYNITFHVELNYFEDFQNFIKNEHLPSLAQDDKIIDHQFLKLLNVDNSEGVSLALHYVLKDMADYNLHIAKVDSQLKKLIQERYEEKVLYFCSVLEKV